VFGHGSQRATANDAKERAGRMVQQGIAVLRYDKRGVVLALSPSRIIFVVVVV